MNWLDAPTGVVYCFGVNFHWQKWIRNWAMAGVVVVAGCGRPEPVEPVEPAAKPVAVVEVALAGAPQSQAGLKLVDDQGLANGLIALAAQTNLTAGVPAQLVAGFFDSLAAGESLVTDGNGRVAVAQLRPQHWVIARAAEQLWVVPAHAVRDWKLRLDESNAGGQRVAALVRERDAVRVALTDAAQQAFKAGRFAQARSLAELLGDAGLVDAINRDAAAALVAQGQAAFDQSDFGTARQLAE